MWRAWGVVLLVLSQDVAPAFENEEHEFSIQPPAGWVARSAQRPTVVKFLHEGPAGKADAELMITHLLSGNPTPTASFQAQARDHVKERYPEGKVLEDRTLEVGGRPSLLLSWSNKGLIHLKVAVQRTSLEWYVLDSLVSEAQVAAFRPLIDASTATFRIRPAPLRAEERPALARTLVLLKGAKLDPALKGERWYQILLGGKKAGHQRLKIDESGGLVVFELDVVLDLGDGNRDSSVVRGSYSPDGRVQKLESEQVKENDKKEKWVFRASASIEGGKARASLDMNGAKEEQTFGVEEGVIFSDVAEVFRSVLVGAGKGTYLLRTLNPFVQEPNLELVDVGVLETLKLDGVERETVMVQSRVDRRKTLTYAYGADRRLLRLGGTQDLFVVRASTREEALAK